MSDEAVGCSVCHRALYARDADREGRCIDCRPATIERARRAEEREQAEAEKAQDRSA